MTRLHVVAAVIRDDRGRVLLTRREAGRDFAGLWEFPGGKLEPGERAFQALARELREELGIDIAHAEPLIAVPFTYPGKRILLDVHTVTGAQGEPQGRENQALAWVEPEALQRYPMPPADRPVVAALREPALCLVTPEPESLAEFRAGLAVAIERGVRRIQLRVKRGDAAWRRALAEAALSLLRPVRGELLINGDAALAAELGCGLHLNSAALMAARRRPVLPRVSASCHDAVQLQQAERIGVDFVLLAPVAATATHPDARPLGWPGFAELRAQCSLPIYALGGLGPADLACARAHGAQGIAAIRGLWPRS